MLSEGVGQRIMLIEKRRSIVEHLPGRCLAHALACGLLVAPILISGNKSQANVFMHGFIGLLAAGQKDLPSIDTQ